MERRNSCPKPLGGEHERCRVHFKVAYRTEAGPVRIVHLPGESQSVIFSVHGAIAEHYQVDPATLKESHSSTIDYVISATAG
jgi:hypothetical protein